MKPVMLSVLIQGLNRVKVTFVMDKEKHTTNQYARKIVKLYVSINKLFVFFKTTINLIKYSLRLVLSHSYAFLKRKIPAELKLKIKYKLYRYPIFIKWAKHLRHWLKINQSSNEALFYDKIILFLLNSIIIKSLFFLKKDKFKQIILQQLIEHPEIKQQILLLIGSNSENRSQESIPQALSSIIIDAPNTLSKTAQYLYMDIKRTMIYYEK